MAEAREAPSVPDASGDELPPLVRRYLKRVLPCGRAVPRQVQITQEGRMRQKPGGRAMRFTAVQRFAVERIGFSWQARFPVAGPLALRIVDEYVDGEGRLEGRLLGVPVLRQAGPEAATAQALRYLAELPWVPHAMVRNGELEWRELDERSVEVAAHVDGDRLAVKLRFATPATSCARQRPCARTGSPSGWCRRRGGGELGEHATLGGTRIPTSARVYWDLPAGRFTYWYGTVTGLELLDSTFQP